MMAFIGNLLRLLRKSFQSKSASLFGKMQEKDTSKIKMIAPKQLKMIMIGIGITLIVVVVFATLFGDDEKLKGGFETYQKDLKPSIGVNSETDVFTNSLNSSSLEFSVMDKNKNSAVSALEKELSNMGKESSAGGSRGTLGGSGTNGELTATDCLNIFDKLKNNTKLSELEQEQSKECLDKNIASLTEAEKAAYSKLADPNLSDEEKKILRKNLNNEYDPGSPEDKILSELLDGNKNAEACLEAMKSRDKKAIEICAKSLDGEELTPEEKARLEKYQKMAEENAKNNISGEKNGSTEQDQKTKELAGNEEKAKELAKQIAEDEAKREQIKKEIKEAEQKAKEAASKIAAGQATKLTEAEQKAIQKIAELNKQASELEKQQEAKKAEFKKTYSDLTKSLMQIEATMKQTFPSGITVEFSEIPNCRTVSTLVPKKKTITPKITKKVEDKELYLDANGKALTPDKIRYVQLMRQQKYEFEKMKQDAKNPMGEQNASGDGRERLATSGVSQDRQFQINELKVLSDKALKDFELTPDMKIPAIIDSPITISSNQKGQIFRVKIVANIHNPRTGKLMIPKGSIAIANAGSFDNDTGVMNVNISKVSIGSGKTIDVNFTLGSADGSIGLKGEVYDTSGKYLAGTFIAAFSAGAINFFSQEIIQPFQQSKLTSDALLGAAGNGSAEVMTKVAEMYAQKLQSAPTIFWCPKKIPVILYPN